jgi:hypothetical protein
MDAKAAFLSALNGAVITFVWTGAKLSGFIAVAASLAALVGLLSALVAIAPRQSLRALFGKSIVWSQDYKPFSFYAFIATAYRPRDFESLAAEMGKLDEANLAREALEQHFTVSHVVYGKSLWVARSCYLSMLAILLTVAGILTR